MSDTDRVVQRQHTGNTSSNTDRPPEFERTVPHALPFPEEDETGVPINQLPGFSTAKGKPIVISEMALSQARQRFALIFDETEAKTATVLGDVSNLQISNLENDGLMDGQPLHGKRRYPDLADSETGPSYAKRQHLTESVTERSEADALLGNQCSPNPPFDQDTVLSIADVQGNLPARNAKIQSCSTTSRPDTPSSASSDSSIKFSCSLGDSRSSPVLRCDWEPESLKQHRSDLIEKQWALVQAKRDCKPAQVTGVLFARKRLEERESEKFASSSNSQCKYYPLENRYRISPNDAEACSFRCLRQKGFDDSEQMCLSVTTNDGSELIFGKGGTVSLPEIRRSFLATPGVDPKAISDRWIQHHYGSIVYKFLFKHRTDRHNGVPEDRNLDPLDVLEELKYRYDTEIDRLETSAISLIVSKAQPASRRIVLRVLHIDWQDQVEKEPRNKETNNRITEDRKSSPEFLLLTDGRYYLKAKPDRPMIEKIKAGIVYEGVKLMIQGAELHGCESACSPLEVPRNAYLQIRSNSTRLATPDEKLGNYRLSGAMRVELCEVNKGGGIVGRLIVGVVKIYQNLYREEIENGVYVYRHQSFEERLAQAHEEKRRSVLKDFQNQFCRTVHRDYENRGPWFDAEETIGLETARLKKAYYEFLTESAATTSLTAAAQRYQNAEWSYRKALLDALSNHLPPVRKTEEVKFVRIASDNATGILVIPQPHASSLWMKEGQIIEITNVIPESRSRPGHSIRTLRLLMNRESGLKWVQVGARVPVLSRDVTDISQIVTAGEKFQPEYQEFDTVGIVVAVLDRPREINSDIVCLAHPDKEDPEKIYCLRLIFPYSIAENGHEETMVVGTALACANLAWLQLMPRTDGAYCSPQSLFYRNPPADTKLSVSFQLLDNLVKDRVAFAAKAISQIVLRQILSQPAFGHIDTDWSSEDDG